MGGGQGDGAKIKVVWNLSFSPESDSAVISEKARQGRGEAVRFGPGFCALPGRCVHTARLERHVSDKPVPPLLHQ